MLAVNGIYHNERVTILEKLPRNKSYKVIVTLVEEIDENEIDKEELLLREMSSNADCFSFWNNPDEDLYQEYLKK